MMPSYPMSTILAGRVTLPGLPERQVDSAGAELRMLPRLQRFDAVVDQPGGATEDDHVFVGQLDVAFGCAARQAADDESGG